MERELKNITVSDGLTAIVWVAGTAPVSRPPARKEWVLGT